MKTMKQRRLFELTRIDWETPLGLFAALNQEFRFTLDVCATPRNAKVPFHFSPEDDGLRQSWVGERCWMNPPYGREIGEWIRKAHDSGALVVGLIPARTDTAWWHDYIQGKAEVRFIRGRLRFGNSNQNAPFPSAIVVWRPR